MMNRRDVVVGGGLGVAVASEASAQPRPARPPIVLVHGAWHGGWCWRRVAPRLEAAGHTVTCPTLTGLGERRHLMSRSVSLTTHIEDVVQHIESEELMDVVLVAHSYGGFVASGAVEHLGPRLSHLVLLDAFHPLNGETVNAYAGEAASAERAEQAARDPLWNIAPLPAAAFGVTDAADAAWIERRLSPQPVGTYTEPIRIERGTRHLARRTYLSCDDPALPVLDDTRARIRADASWRYVGLPVPHDAMVTHPELLSTSLLNLIA
jgi:pimeloyl-ACP methyl ester carboxylesterase